MLNTIFQKYNLRNFAELIDAERRDNLTVIAGEYNHKCIVIHSTSRVRFQPATA